MQRIIAVVVALAAVGIVTAFAADQLIPSHDAGAAPQPQVQQVREQNLDGSGFIRVHEQGTPNVNVSKLPLGRLSLVAENVNAPPSEHVVVRFDLDTADCRALTLFTNHGPMPLAYPLQAGALLSADGTAVNGPISKSTLSWFTSFV